MDTCRWWAHPTCKTKNKCAKDDKKHHRRFVVCKAMKADVVRNNVSATASAWLESQPQDGRQTNSITVVLHHELFQVNWTRSHWQADERMPPLAHTHIHTPAQMDGQARNLMLPAAHKMRVWRSASCGWLDHLPARRCEQQRKLTYVTHTELQWRSNDESRDRTTI